MHTGYHQYYCYCNYIVPFYIQRGPGVYRYIAGTEKDEVYVTDLHARSSFRIEFPNFVSNLLREEPVGALLFVPQHFGLSVSAALAVVARALAHVWHQACIASLHIRREGRVGVRSKLNDGTLANCL